MVQSSECRPFHVSKLLKIPKLERTFNSEGEDKQSYKWQSCYELLSSLKLTADCWVTLIKDILEINTVILVADISSPKQNAYIKYFLTEILLARQDQIWYNEFLAILYSWDKNYCLS